MVGIGYLILAAVAGIGAGFLFRSRHAFWGVVVVVLACVFVVQAYWGFSNVSSEPGQSPQPSNPTPTIAIAPTK